MPACKPVATSSQPVTMHVPSLYHTQLVCDYTHEPQAATQWLRAAKVAISLAVLAAALVVASLDPPKTASAALRQHEQPRCAFARSGSCSTTHDKLLPGGLPGGAAGLLSSGGLLALGGSLMTGGGAGSNGSAAVTAVAQAPTALAAALPAWATKTASHGGSVLADKTTPLGVGPILLEDVKQV